MRLRASKATGGLSVRRGKLHRTPGAMTLDRADFGLDAGKGPGFDMAATLRIPMEALSGA